MTKIYTSVINSVKDWKQDILFPALLFNVSCLILVLSSFSTKSTQGPIDNNKEKHFTSSEIPDLSGSDEASLSVLAQCCTRTVSNTYQCQNSFNYVFYLARKDKDGNVVETESYKIGSPSNISWDECDDGTAHFSAIGLTARNSTETIDLNFTYTGKNTNGSGKPNGCDSSVDLPDWSYYANTSGTFTSSEHGSYTISESGGDFQTGTKANVTSASGFGGSGWFDAHGSYWTNGDVNIQLSAIECTAPAPNCSGSDYSWSGMDKFIEGQTTQRCYNLSGFENAAEIDITEMVTFDCYANRAASSGQQQERLTILFKDASGNVVGQSSNYSQDLQDGVEKASWVGSLGKVQLSGAGVTQVCVVHYGDPANGNGPQGSPNSVYIAGLCLKITDSCNANNFHPGEYSNGNQSYCGSTDPHEITATAATGCSGGNIEYRWSVKKYENGVWSDWSIITGANGPNYDPANLSVSRWYIREARCAPCGDWVKTYNPYNGNDPSEGRAIDVHISRNYSDGGTIGVDQEFCGSGDPAKINSVTDPSGGVSTWDGFLNTKWQKMTLTGSWEDISGFVDDGDNTPDVPWMYDPGTIDETTKYRRAVRIRPCMDWVYSNIVTITIVPTCHITDDAHSQTVECDNNGNTGAFNDWIASNGGAEASSKDCSWDYEITDTKYTCGNTGDDNGPKEVTVTFILHSCDGNKTTVAKFIVEDKTPPSITAAPDRTVECLEEVAAEEPSFTQECSHITVTTTGPTLLSGDAGCDGAVYEFEYKVEDACKNVTNATQTFTLKSDDPTISCAADKTVSCAADIVVDLGSVSSSAACGDNGNISADGPHPVTGNSQCGDSDGDKYTITYTIEDACGRISHCTQTFTIDSAEPTISCAPDAVVTCYSDIAADLNSVNTTAACGDNGNVSADGPHPVAGNSQCGDSDGDKYTITYTITDACGRTDHCTQTFTIDGEEPTIDCPANVNVTCYADIVSNTAGVTYSTGCSLTATVTAGSVDPVAGNSACGESDGDQYTIEYQVEDECGRTANCTQTFTITGSVPTISCPADVTVECFREIKASIDDAQFTTACSQGATVDAGEIIAAAGNSQCGEIDGDQYTITYVVTDDCGRTAECTQTFTLDSAEPTIDCPANKVVSCFDEVVADIDGVSTTSSCGNNGTVSVEGPIADNDNSACGELDGDRYTFIYTVTDECGRKETCEQLLIIDSEEPTITCAANKTVDCLGDIIADISSVATSAACGENGNVNAGPITADAGNSQCGELDGDSYSITYTITDACGREASCTQTFTIDSAEPTISCPADETVSCLDEVIANIGGASSTGSCGDDGSITAGDPVGAAGNSACGESDGDSYTITYTVTDGCGREANCTQTFTIDSDEPTITCPADETVSCLEEVVANIGDASSTGSCGDDGSITAGDPVGAAGNSACGESDGDTYTITYTVTDACGREASCTQTFTIDSDEPTITCPADETVSCLEEVVANIGDASSTGSCGDDGSITAGDPVGAAGNSACGESDGDTYTITYTVTDACGREASCTQTFTIDSDEPTITCPADETVSCLEEVVANIGDASSTGSCGDDGSITAGDPVGAAGNSACGESDGDTYTISYTVTDACGREASCTQTFTIDSDEPTITCPADETVSCLEEVVAKIGDASSTGSCGDDGSITAGDPVGAAGNSACGESDGDTYTITYTVTDACGREASCTQTFTIDSDEPTITCPADETVSCLEEVVANIGDASSTGSCGDDGSITAGDPVGAAGNSACGESDGDTYTITYTVTDACGREASCTQTFTIDSDEPTITCPADETVSCLEEVVANIGDASSTGSCGDDGSITAGDPVGAAGNSACGESDGDTYTITYTVTDGCGREATCTQTFTIDSDEPTITCPADETVSCLEEVVANIGDASSTGSCGDDGSITAGDPVGAAGNSACGESDGDTYTITYTVTDGCGREATCTQTFTIDSDEPTITCPADETVSCLEEVVANIGDASSTGSCGDDGSITAGDPVGAAGNSACGESDGDTYTITYTVTDGCGREATCTQTFTINSEEPTISCPADETVSCLEEVVANIGGASSTGSCGDDGSITAGDPVGAAGNSACGESDGDTYTITYTVTDGCGREATCTQTFTINSEEPTISCPADETVSCLEEVVANIGGASSTGSCGDDGSIAAGDPVGAAGNSACGESDGDTYTITYTVTDGCGREATCTQTFTIDSDEPTISCAANASVACKEDIAADLSGVTTNVSCGDDGNVTAGDPVLVSGDDNCDGAEYEITYTVTDGCGRTAECTQTFTLDVPATDIDVPATETVECLGDIVASDPTVTTGCGIGYTAEVSDPILTGGSAGCDGATYEVTYTVTDDCGGITTAVTEFTIDNSGAISIDCEPDDITLECSGGNTNQQAADAWNQDNIDKLLACSSTNCTGDLFVTSDYDFNNFTTSCGGGSITVKYTITGSCGEVVEETAFLTIEDTMAPTVTANDITVDLDPNTGTVTITPEMVLGSSDDNCNDPTLTVEPNTFTQDDCGENVVTLVATDACGNTGTATATVTIECLYDLSLTKQVSDASPQIGQSVTYTIQVSNSLGLTATGVSVQDQLPNGLSNPTGISNSGSVSGSNINWSNLTVPGNGSISLSFSATVVAGTDYVNLAEITGADQPDIDSNPGNGADTNGNGIVGSEDPDGSQDPADEDDGDDAVIEPTGKISGTVKSDDDNNGTGDSGIDGVTLVLKDTNGNTVATTTTDGSGFYEFDDVPAGNYIIMEMDPAGYVDVSDSDDTTGPNDPDGGNDPQDDQIPVTLAPGEFDDGNNFVELKLGTISGTVTKDTDGNGSGDDPISGVQIVLKDGSGNTIATTTTDGNGFYEFVDLEPGTYGVMEMQPDGLIDVSDEDATPDPDGADGVVDNSIPVTLGVGEDDADNNFVEAEEGSISGSVKEDTDGDGIGDDPISGVTIILKDTNGNTIATTTTDGSGNYEFTGVAPGDYIIMEMDPAGYSDVSDEDATPDPDGGNDPVDDQIPVTVSPGEQDADNNFVEERLGTISGNVKEDTNGDGTGDDPISGVQIVLKDGSGNTIATTTTDNNGNYEFLDLTPGEYVVMEMQPDGFEDVSDEDATPDPDGADGVVNNSIPVTLAPGEDDDDNNFVEAQKASVSGFVLEDRDNNDSGDAPIPGVQIVLKDGAGTTIATANTDNNGFYEFLQLAPGAYTLMEMQPDRYLDVSDEDETPDPDGADGIVNNSIPVNLTGGESDTDNNFVEEGFVSVGSTVFRDDNNNGVQDSNESGISGVVVQLLDMNGGVIATTTTDGSGNYFFGDLEPGMYFVRIPNPDNTYNTSSTGNGGDNGVDGDDNGIQSAPGEETTSPKITLLPNGESSNEPFSGGNQDNAEDFNGDMTIDFGFYGPGSIGDFVWFDINGDGNQDGGEPGLQGVTVNLLDGSGNFIASTTTGSEGQYLFSGLAPGDYIIEFVTPADYTEVVSSGTDPSNGSSNSDYNPSTGRTAVVGLGSGENITGVDGGFNLILEVSLVSFTAKYDTNRELVDLNWATSNEVNSDYYVVERAYENGAFESIGRVDAAGTSTSELSYNLEDEGIDASGTYLYRLQMVDTDGSFSYSDIISIAVRRSEVSEPSVNIFPNPVYDEVNVDIIKNEGDRIEVSLFDLTGRAIGISNVDVQSRGNQASIKVPVKDIARGSYILRINVGDHVFTKKVLFVR